MNPARPASVHIAAFLQSIAVLLSLAAVVLAWAGHASITGQYRYHHWDELRFADDNNTMAFAVALTAIGGLTALWFGLTLLPTWLGSNTARLMAAIGAGFYQLVVVVFCICGSLFALFTMPIRMMPDDMYEDPYHPGSLIPRDEAAGWEQFAAGMIVLSVAVILLAVLILLVVPPSNRFYAARKVVTSDGTPRLEA